MNKLLMGLFLGSIFQLVHGSAKDTYREVICDLVSKSEFIATMFRYQDFDLIKQRDFLFRATERQLPGISKFEQESNFYSPSPLHELRFLIDLEERSRTCPELRPVVKRVYTNCLKFYKKKEMDSKLYGPQSKFPKKSVIESYPSSYEQGSGAGIVFGPLLNPKSMTAEQYNKQVQAYYQKLGNTLKFFLKNRSEILFPGIFGTIACVQHPKKISDEIGSLIPSDVTGREEALRAPSFSKPNEKRDLAVLKAYWKACLKDESLVPFVEKGHANFKKYYGYSAPVRSLKLKDGLTLGMYADKNKNSKVSMLCHKLDPVPTSFFAKAAVVGIISGIGYLAYKKYRNYKDSTVSGNAIDLTSASA